jgi:heme exporter protein D
MSEFLHMGGYASFVWGSFGAFAVLVLWNIVTASRKRRQVLKQLAEAQAEAGDGDD